MLWNSLFFTYWQLLFQYNWVKFKKYPWITNFEHFFNFSMYSYFQRLHPSLFNYNFSEARLRFGSLIESCLANTQKTFKSELTKRNNLTCECYWLKYCIIYHWELTPRWNVLLFHILSYILRRKYSLY